MFYQAVERFGKIHFFCNSAGLQTYGTFIGTDEICPGSIDTPLLRFGASEHGETEKYLLNGVKTSCRADWAGKINYPNRHFSL